MFQWTIIFVVIAIAASFFGMNNIAGLSKELAYVFFIIALIFALMGIFKSHQRKSKNTRKT